MGVIFYTIPWLFSFYCCNIILGAVQIHYYTSRGGVLAGCKTSVRGGVGGGCYNYTQSKKRGENRVKKRREKKDNKIGVETENMLIDKKSKEKGN